MTNPFAYQHEKLGAAVHALMLPDVPFEKKLAGAMTEFSVAFQHPGSTVPSGPALQHYLKIEEIMGEGNFEQRAKTLTAEQRFNIVTAFWELDRAVSRDYFIYEARQ